MRLLLTGMAAATGALLAPSARWCWRPRRERRRRWRGVGIGRIIIDRAAARHLAVGVEFFFGAGEGVPIELDRHANDGLVGPEHLLQHAFGFLGQVLLIIAPGGKLVAGQTGDGIVLLILGEDVALVVHHGNVVGLEAFDTVGDEKTNGIDRGRGQLRRCP